MQIFPFFQIATVGCMRLTFRKALETLQDEKGFMDITQEELLALKWHHLDLPQTGIQYTSSAHSQT